MVKPLIVGKLVKKKKKRTENICRIPYPWHNNKHLHPAFEG